MPFHVSVEKPIIERVLAIETSCDDTSVAVVARDGMVRVLVSRDQDLAHVPFGGIVPEIAGRKHVEVLLPLVDVAVSKMPGGWGDIDGIVVTNRPGLLGSLLVGVVTAKTLALAKKKPFLGVNHLEGHIFAPFLRDGEYLPSPTFQAPFISLAVSGGHTSLYEIKAFGDYELLGATRDDAAGEAFDKFAKLIGLGFPGGAAVDRNARTGDPSRYSFPRGLRGDGNLGFSFSGLKSAAQRLVQTMSKDQLALELPHLCASFQEAVVDSLVEKLALAARTRNVKRVSVTGGVSANSRLREKVSDWAKSMDIELAIPPLRFCTDNAAMIGWVGIQRLNLGERDDQSLAPSPKPDALFAGRKGPQ